MTPPPSKRRWFSFPVERIKWRIHTLVNTRLSYSKYRKIGAGEMAQWLKVVRILVMDRNSPATWDCSQPATSAPGPLAPSSFHTCHILINKHIKNKSKKVSTEYWMSEASGHVWHFWWLGTLPSMSTQQKRKTDLSSSSPDSPRVLLARDFSEVCNQPVPACGHSF